MTVTAEDIVQFAEKKVVLTYVNAEGVETSTEGKAEAANALGILLKPKGKTNLELVELASIVGVEHAPEPTKELKAKTLKVVDHGAAKTHLLERHGYTLSEVNGLDEATALEVHTQIDHPAEDLGHVHGPKASAEKAEAIEAQAAEADAE